MKIWIVCRPCPDSYYSGSPTGIVFADLPAAEAYVLKQNGPDADDFALYLREGELQGVQS